MRRRKGGLIDGIALKGETYWHVDAWQYVRWMSHFQVTRRYSPEKVGGFVKEDADVLEGLANKAKTEGTEPFWNIGWRGTE
jgi:hypothetical protein